MFVWGLCRAYEYQHALPLFLAFPMRDLIYFGQTRYFKIRGVGQPLARPKTPKLGPSRLSCVYNGILTRGMVVTESPLVYTLNLRAQGGFSRDPSALLKLSFQGLWPPE